jgi:hypothetical protein
MQSAGRADRQRPQKAVSTEADRGRGQGRARLILRIWQRHLAARREELSRRMKEQDGPARQETMREIAELLLDLNKLKRGWAQAEPILDLYLQKRAEG